MFSCEFYEISKNTFLAEHFWAIASILLELLRYALTSTLISAGSDLLSLDLLSVYKWSQWLQNLIHKRNFLLISIIIKRIEPWIINKTFVKITSRSKIQIALKDWEISSTFRYMNYQWNVIQGNVKIKN